MWTRPVGSGDADGNEENAGGTPAPLSSDGRQDACTTLKMTRSTSLVPFSGKSVMK